jgi:hypothetical protein
MVELLLSLGLFSLLLVGLLQLLDTSTDLWRRVEKRRERTEVASAFTARLERDLSTLEAGPEGDFLADWTMADVDGNGLAGLPLARLRFVRRASARDLARLHASQEEPTTGALDKLDALEDPDGDVAWRRLDRGLVEVAWVLAPSDDKVFHGRLLRAERLLDDPERMSLFDPRLFGVAGRPVPGLFEELSGGVLWMDMVLATPMTATGTETSSTDGVVSRWKVGDAPTDGGASWDAWLRGRPNREITALNTLPTGLPATARAPLLPRRVRVGFEVQAEADRALRTSLVSELDHNTINFLVVDGRRVPEAGGFVLVDEEWLEVRSVVGEHVTVRRGQRGTPAVAHKAGAKLWYGWRTEIELPIGMAREDWNL